MYRKPSTYPYMVPTVRSIRANMRMDKLLLGIPVSAVSLPFGMRMTNTNTKMTPSGMFMKNTQY